MKIKLVDTAGSGRDAHLDNIYLNQYLPPARSAHVNRSPAALLLPD